MAKKEKLSLEELLKQALVKDEDKPYEVPGNWVWTRLGAVMFLQGGGTPSKAVREFWNGSILWASVKDIKDRYLMQTEDSITEIGFQNSSTFLAVPGDVILVTRISPGKSSIASVDVAINQDLKVIKKKLPINSLFLWGYFTLMISEIENMASGTTVKGITAEKVHSLPFALPPLPEQQRIVDIIESLFEKLDRAKELAQNALDSFETRKSAILHKAFTGELTKKWREENGVEFRWKSKTLKEVAIFRAGYAFDSTKFTDSGRQVIRMGNLYNGILDLSRNPVYIKEIEIDSNILKRSKVMVGDILLTLTGTKYKRDYGVSVLITDEINALVNQRIVCLTAKNIDPKYLWNYLRTELFRNVFFSNETGGVNQGNVSSKFVETIAVPVPLIQEQKEIVRILDSLLENEEKAKELCNVIDKIDHMKKAILARAFRGELGTNNPDEESSLDLLKEVLEEKV